MDLDIKVLENVITNYFSKKKNIDLLAEKRCLTAGYDIKDLKNKDIPKVKNTSWSKSKVITGNESLALGAIASGCRAYYAYPMTPATSILEVLGNTSFKTNILVKQAESEITAAQMVMGSMYMGTRAFTATSGGGFDRLRFKFPEKPPVELQDDEIDTSIVLNRRNDGRPAAMSSKAKQYAKANRWSSVG